MEIVASPKLTPSLGSTLGSPLRVQRKPFGSVLTGALRSPNPRFTKRPLSPVDCESQHNIGGAVATTYVAKLGAAKCRSGAKCASTNELVHGRLDLHDFNVGKAIGKGRFGNVYLASAKGLEGGVNGPLAIKVVSKLQLEQASTDSSAVFKKEVEILQSLVHRHIVRLYG
jgi:serine/threonine protein kinase